MKLLFAASALAVCLTASAASADVIDVFSFSGTLTNSDTVTGTFDLDETNPSLFSYSFSTPNGTVDGSDSTGFGFDFTGVTPSGSFLRLEIETNDTTQIISLIFAGDIGTYSGGPLTLSVFDGFTTDGSGLVCTSSCTGFSGPVEFSDGTATFESTFSTTPEPATWALMLAGFAGMGAALRSRRRLTPA